MPARKVWVKRPNATATQVAVNDDDLVDDVKDLILRKYANSLGRNFDPPDVVLKVSLAPRGSRHTNERSLAPDEQITKILDMIYPGGQSIDEALTIDVPQRRTPKHSPRALMHTSEGLHPSETANDYFPPMPLNVPHSPRLTTVQSVPALSTMGTHRTNHPHSIAILETGLVPSLPSPTALRSRANERANRPRYARQHTTSPVVLTPGGSTQLPHETHRSGSNSGTNASHTIDSAPQRQSPPTPPPRIASPRPGLRSRRTKKSTAVSNHAFGLSTDSVPPINVLIVEDNIINLKLLEAFLKRLKVRWSTAMNGAVAVSKWREGGFHLVLMDIQLPIMNGLDATKEIRRLERVNDIGVFSNTAPPSPLLDGAVENDEEEEKSVQKCQRPPKEDDLLPNKDLFKSPVIIVALTASSLQSDRHEALAAGCNDFLTKPVNFDWLSRKVMEWGCMQALIDFDGWRNWKAFNAANNNAAKKAIATGTSSHSPYPKQTQAQSTARPGNAGAMNGAGTPAVDTIANIARSTKSPVLLTRSPAFANMFDGGTSSSGDGAASSEG